MSPDYGGNFMTIYELLDLDKKSPEIASRVYFNDSTIAQAITYLNRDQGRFFGAFDDFRKDCQKGRLPAYSVVEPRFSSQDDDRFPANDQHPDHGVDRGETFIKNVYTMIRRNQSLWESTLLVITYDEHGGLYDHVPPPATVSPDDKMQNLHDFKFDRLGVRVPAVLVSPYIKPGTILSEVFDHTSIIATARELFTKNPKTNALTKRDAQANTVTGCLNLEAPRTDNINFPKPRNSEPSLGTFGIASLATVSADSGPSTLKPPRKRQLSEYQRALLQIGRAVESKMPVEHHSGKNSRTVTNEAELAAFLEDVKNKMLKRPKRRGGAERQPVNTVRALRTAKKSAATVKPIRTAKKTTKKAGGKGKK
jgi:phospholipase C